MVHGDAQQAFNAGGLAVGVLAAIVLWWSLLPIKRGAERSTYWYEEKQKRKERLTRAGLLILTAAFALQLVGSWPARLWGWSTAGGFMEAARLVLDYLKLALTWPPVTLVLVIAAFRSFRDPLCRLIDRFVEGEGYGVRLKATPARQLEEAGESVQSPSANDIVQFVSEHPEEAKAAYERLFNGYWFERAFNLIFGSQLELLEHLAQRGDAGEQYVNLKRHFDEFLNRGGEKATQMADYLEFLRKMGFMRYDGDAAKITPLGVNFLSYLHANYVDVNKLRAL